jgi:hypothetical protein
MIDSVIWKEKLEQDLCFLKKRLAQRNWSYRSIVLFERELTLIFFSIRALIDAGKLTDITAQKEFECVTYPNLGKVVDDFTKYWPIENYDFSAGISKNFSLQFLTNQFIHAYVLWPKFSEKGQVLGVLLCSDREKQSSLIEITTTSAISIVQNVIDDEINSIHLARDKKTNELRKTKIL